MLSDVKNKDLYDNRLKLYIFNNDTENCVTKQIFCFQNVKNCFVFITSSYVFYFIYVNSLKNTLFVFITTQSTDCKKCSTKNGQHGNKKYVAF